MNRFILAGAVAVFAAALALPVFAQTAPAPPPAPPPMATNPPMPTEPAPLGTPN
jgi:hypothetical protein